jgi:Co/Zn/Cd efflux system component
MQDAIMVANHQHSHVFDEADPLAERNTCWVVWLTISMMIAEVAGAPAAAL